MARANPSPNPLEASSCVRHRRRRPSRSHPLASLRLGARARARALCRKRTSHPADRPRGDHFLCAPFTFRLCGVRALCATHRRVSASPSARKGLRGKRDAQTRFRSDLGARGRIPRSSRMQTSRVSSGRDVHVERAVTRTQRVHAGRAASSRAAWPARARGDLAAGAALSATGGLARGTVPLASAARAPCAPCARVAASALGSPLTSRASCVRNAASAFGSASTSTSCAPPSSARAASTPASAGEVTAVVLVDHGSRVKRANAALDDVARAYAQRTGRSLVFPAHMELASPTIAEACEAARDAGATRVVVAPFFLSPGKHVRRDVPRLVREAAEKLVGSCQVVLAEYVGGHPLVTDAVEARVLEAVGDGAGSGNGGTGGEGEGAASEER